MTMHPPKTQPVTPTGICPPNHPWCVFPSALIYCASCSPRLSLSSPVSAFHPASRCLFGAFNDSAMSYICSKWSGGWMLGTESEDDSEKMTGLWRREVLAIRTRRMVPWWGGCSEEWEGEEKGWCLDKGRELRLKVDVKKRMSLLYLAWNGRELGVGGAGVKEKRIRERWEEEKWGGWREHLSWQVKC